LKKGCDAAQHNYGWIRCAWRFPVKAGDKIWIISFDVYIEFKVFFCDEDRIQGLRIDSGGFFVLVVSKSDKAFSPMKKALSFTEP